MASVRSCWKFHPCLMEPMSASSKTGSPLAKAEPFSNGDRTAESSRGRKPGEWQQPEKRGVRICGRHIQASGEGRQEMLRYQSRDSPAACGAAHGEAAVPLQPQRPQECKDPPGAHGQPHTTADRCPKETMNPLESPQCTSLLAVFVTPQGREGSPKRKLRRSRKKGWVGHMFTCFNI